MLACLLSGFMSASCKYTHKMEREPPPSVKLQRLVVAGKPLMTETRLRYVGRSNALVQTLMTNGFAEEIRGPDEVIMKKLGFFIVKLAHHNVVQGNFDDLSVGVVMWWLRRTAEGQVDFTDIVYDLFRKSGAPLE